ncbi:TPA: helix-turn-helix domain-containing protein [Vibrio parahaemolyticus]
MKLSSSMSLKPIDNTLLLSSVNELLEPTRRNLVATPDVSALIPFVRDIVFEEIVTHCQGNQTKAAKMLGINRGTLRQHMNRIQSQQGNDQFPFRS